MTKEEMKDYGVKVTQASQTGLIVLMYEITINYIDSAIQSYEKKDFDSFGYNLKKAKTFINELSSILEMKYAIGQELHKIYIFMNNTIVKAGIRKDISELVRVKGMLIQLKAAFKEVEKSDSSGPLMENTQHIYAGLTYSKNSLNENIYSEKNRGYTV